MSEAREPGVYWVETTSGHAIGQWIVRRALTPQFEIVSGPSTQMLSVGPRIPNAETIEKLWAVAHAAREYIEAVVREPPESAGYYLALDEAVAALGPLPDDKKA